MTTDKPSYSESMRGVLFRNEDRRGDRDPNYRGSCEVAGVQYWISSWIKESKKDGTKYMTLSFSPKQAKQIPVATKAEEFEDEIPF